ncbi:phage tail family protein, partial [Micromonospora chalcea]|uniref:phage tail family protein n=1 Tax=Micromonospora chalcea TaxID=1874 RepID=UPI0021A6F81C
AEWAEQVAVAMRLVILARGPVDYMDRLSALLAAFAPAGADVDLRFVIGGVEYLLQGRPRMVDPEPRHVDGHTYVQAAFVALDPTIYSGVEHSTTLGLPSTVGGLTLPATAPLTVSAAVTSGRGSITNAGTKATGLLVRVDGPVAEPRISLLTDAGTAVVRVWATLTAGQWLDIDTAARTVYLNGTASRRGVTTADGAGWPVLPPRGSYEIAFDASAYSAAATATVRWRDTWH